MTYYEKLRLPQWQKKRAEILERENWTCQECGDTEKQLHVHHGFYARGTDPWEYPSETLSCLCETCHEDAQFLMEMVHRNLAYLCTQDQVQALGYIAGLDMLRRDRKPIGNPSPTAMIGVADAWQIPREAVADISSVCGATLASMRLNCGGGELNTLCALGG